MNENSLRRGRSGSNPRAQRLSRLAACAATRSNVLFLTALLLSIASAAGFASAQADEPRIHLLVVADTSDPTIGMSVGSDLYRIGNVFDANVPKRQLRATTLSEDDVRPAEILSTVRGLDIVSGRDTVVFYYSGHGAFDRQANDHLLLPRQVSLSRREVRTAIQSLRPRLTVIITDTCSTFLRTPAITEAAPPTEQISPLFRSLFLDPSGLIDISCSRPGEAAIGNSNGGYFTFSLTKYWEANRRRPLNWTTVLTAVNGDVSRSHRDARQTAYFVGRESGSDGPATGHEAQTPGVENGETRRPRFGVTAQRTLRSARVSGVAVTLVMPGYPGTALRSRSDGKKYQLVVGRDIITHINGSSVDTYDGFVSAVQSSPTEMVVRVYDTQMGSHEDYDVTLEPTGAAGLANDSGSTGHDMPGGLGSQDSSGIGTLPDDAGIDYFAAIAFSPSTRAYGYSFRARTREAAEQSALDRCRKDDARVLTWSRNGWCALALGRGGVAYGWAAESTADEARSKALESCRQRALLASSIAVCVSAREGASE